MKAQMDTSSIEEINKKEQFRNYAIHLEKISEDFSFHLDKIKDKSKNNVDISEEEASTVRQLYSEIIRFY
jgi:Na+/phosphate symporter